MGSKQRGYFEEEEAPLSVRERDRLYDERPQSWSAFHPRPAQRLAARRPARSAANLEIGHRLRTFAADTVVPRPTEPFRLWIAGGRAGAPSPPRHDPDYNSNVWRHFSGQSGYRAEPASRLAALAADAYPVRIPPHSEMSDNTFGKFLSEVPVIRDRRRREQAISRSVRELKDFKELKLRSEMRVPPLDERGCIAPPGGFKRYEQRHQRPATSQTTTATQSLREMTELERDSQRSVLGTHRTGGTRLWKLTFKQNHPNYEKMQADQREKLLNPVKSPIPGEIWFQ